MPCSSGRRNGKSCPRVVTGIGTGYSLFLNSVTGTARPQTAGGFQAVSRGRRNHSNRAGGAMSQVADLKVKIFADGADYEGIVKMSKNPVIKGFTTNPTLMRKAGVSDYEAFARKVLAAIPDRPVSFEVFADDFASMAE